MALSCHVFPVSDADALALHAPRSAAASTATMMSVSLRMKAPTGRLVTEAIDWRWRRSGVTGCGEAWCEDRAQAGRTTIDGIPQLRRRPAAPDRRGPVAACPL